MDVDVKNALDKALAVCEAAENSTGLPIVRTFIGDIYSFISSVSVTNSDDRYDYFNKVYLNGNYPSEKFRANSIVSVPKSLKLLRDIDKKKLSKDNKLSNILISFFLVLGKFYSSSQFDRKDVGIAAVTKQVKLMSDYVKAKSSVQSSEKHIPQAKKSTILPERETKELAEEDAPELADQSEPEMSLDELLEKLDSLIGLKKSRKKYRTLST